MHKFALLRTRRGRGVVLLALALLGRSYGADGYRVVRSYPHDAGAFTQGLVFADGLLYESTGLNGRSTVRLDDLETGKVLQHANLPERYFGEGLTAWGGTLIQLTWRSHEALVYDRFSFRLLRTIPFPWDGWGLTADGKSLVASDGTATLRFLRPDTLELVREVVVKDHGATVTELNELEYVRGEIYANVWHTNRIARIAPKSGEVVGWIDLTGVVAEAQVSDPEAVLNGIAYDARRDRLVVTGKLWPKIFEIRVVGGPRGK